LYLPSNVRHTKRLGAAIVDVDLAGDRCLVLSHAVYNGVLLDEKTCQAVLRHIAGLWGYNVRLVETDALLGEILKTHEIEPPPPI